LLEAKNVYTHLDSIPSNSKLLFLSVSPGGAGGVLGGGGAMGQDAVDAGEGVPDPFRLQRLCGFFAVPFWHTMQPAV
jgi:hypothetical protein